MQVSLLDFHWDDNEAQRELVLIYFAVETHSVLNYNYTLNREVQCFSVGITLTLCL